MPRARREERGAAQLIPGATLQGEQLRPQSRGVCKVDVFHVPELPAAPDPCPEDTGDMQPGRVTEFEVNLQKATADIPEHAGYIVIVRWYQHDGGNSEDQNYVTIGDTITITDAFNLEISDTQRVDIDGTVILREIGAVRTPAGDMNSCQTSVPAAGGSSSSLMATMPSKRMKPARPSSVWNGFSYSGAISTAKPSPVSSSSPSTTSARSSTS